ncbi:MAG TPA: hypothetical protein VD793_11570 [Gemmatimonadales bacterium]|nr:hypothetical protein [Gemmatimonadales bacterium]
MTSDDATSVLRAATIILRFRRMVLLTPCITVLAAIAVVVLLPRTHTAVASFVPQSVTPSRLSALAGLSAQLGLGSLPQASSFGSPDFYKELLGTDELLGRLADSRFAFPVDTGSFDGTLADYWNIRQPTPARRRLAAIRRLRGRMNVAVEQRTQLVRLGVTTTSPDLSLALVERALQLVSEFNQDQRQSQSAQERRFLGSRLADAKAELRSAEDSVARFLEQNRDFRNSPPLLFQYDRMQREVTLRQTLYATLAQSFEQSRIEEVRDTPVLTVVETPRLPPRPDSRRLAIKLPLALMVGAVLGVLGAFLRDFFARAAPGGAPDLADFERLLGDARGEFRRPWRLLGIGRA